MQVFEVVYWLAVIVAACDAMTIHRSRYTVLQGCSSLECVSNSPQYDDSALRSLERLPPRQDKSTLITKRTNIQPSECKSSSHRASLRKFSSPFSKVSCIVKNVAHGLKSKVATLRPVPLDESTRQVSSTESSNDKQNSLPSPEHNVALQEALDKLAKSMPQREVLHRPSSSSTPALSRSGSSARESLFSTPSTSALASSRGSAMSSSKSLLAPDSTPQIEEVLPSATMRSPERKRPTRPRRVMLACTGVEKPPNFESHYLDRAGYIIWRERPHEDDCETEEATKESREGGKG